MQPRTFGEEFSAHWVVHSIVQAAGRAGAPVCPEDVIPDLADRFPDFSPSELTRMLCAAAQDAQVPIASPNGGPANLP